MTDEIKRHVLREGDVSITVLSVGCAVQDWTVAGRRMVLGYAEAEAYRNNAVSMGVICGRVANRISNARFDLNGEVWTLPANADPHHIHGGPGGFGWRNWQMEPLCDTHVRLSLHSPHLDQGYPGAVDVTVDMRLDNGALSWDMRAVPDRETPLNLAQHLYFNLGDTASIYNHALRIAAQSCTPTNAQYLPTGARLDVTGTRYDFTRLRRFSEADPETLGFDLNYVLNALSDPDPSAEILAPDGTRLQLWTDRPGLQLYTSNTLRACAAPLQGQIHAPFAGVCLEAQDFPNALNTPGFGSILCTPERPYTQSTRIRIDAG